MTRCLAQNQFVPLLARDTIAEYLAQQIEELLSMLLIRMAPEFTIHETKCHHQTLPLAQINGIKNACPLEHNTIKTNIRSATRAAPQITDY